MSTQVQDNGSVELETFLNTPLRGKPENHQIFRSDLIHPAAYDACGVKNCAAHQLSQALSLDYENIWDELRVLFEAREHPREFARALVLLPQEPRIVVHKRRRWPQARHRVYEGSERFSTAAPRPSRTCP